MRNITEASNYRDGWNYGYKHMVGPYYELDFEDIDDGVNIHSFWHSVADDIIALIRDNDSVMIGNPADFDEENNIVFVDIVSDNEEALSKILETLSNEGWSTGIF